MRNSIRDAHNKEQLEAAERDVQLTYNRMWFWIWVTLVSTFALLLIFSAFKAKAIELPKTITLAWNAELQVNAFNVYDVTTGKPQLLATVQTNAVTLTLPHKVTLCSVSAINTFGESQLSKPVSTETSKQLTKYEP